MTKNKWGQSTIEPLRVSFSTFLTHYIRSGRTLFPYISYTEYKSKLCAL